jgi:hypothetical protein
MDLVVVIKAFSDYNIMVNSFEKTASIYPPSSPSLINM